MNCSDKYGNINCEVGDVVQNDEVIFTIGFINYDTKMAFIDKEKPIEILKETYMTNCIKQGNYGTVVAKLRHSKYLNN